MKTICKACWYGFIFFIVVGVPAGLGAIVLAHHGFVAGIIAWVFFVMLEGAIAYNLYYQDV
jgi:hypothetical protein